MVDSNQETRGYVSPWITLADAIKHVDSVLKDGDANAAWGQIKQAIIDNSLEARGLLEGGFQGKVHGNWLSILDYDDANGDILFFNASKRFKVQPNAPARAERIEVDKLRMLDLWKEAGQQGTTGNTSPPRLSVMEQKKLVKTFGPKWLEDQKKTNGPLTEKHFVKAAKDKGISRKTARVWWQADPKRKIAPGTHAANLSSGRIRRAS